MTTPASKKLEETLNRWGISLAAAHYFGLALNGFGNIIYPANPGERRRILVNNPKPNQSKNMWDTDSKDLPASALFHRAALEVHSHLYISNGEKSTMAMWTAGIPNVVNTFGEGNRLDEAVRLFQDHSTQHITVIPDCDKHGIQTAQKWQDRATAAGILIRLLDLRLYFAEQHGMSPADYYKWDTRDLWLLLGQDKAAFQAALNALPELDFNRYPDELLERKPASPLPKKREYPAATHTDGIDYKVAHEDWWFNHVIPVINRFAPLPARGKHRHCPNPHHSDHSPSFRLDEESGMVFCTCGIHNEKKPRHLVAAWVGAISWEDFKKQLREEQKLLQNQRAKTHKQIEDDSSEIVASEVLHFEQGVPDSLRELLLQLHSFHESYDDHAAAILTYELWHLGIRQKLTTPDKPITIELLQDIASQTNRQTTYKTFRRGIEQLVGLGFFVQIGNLPSVTKGRPTHQYAAQKLSDALATLRQKMGYRLREYAYGDSIPDTVTAQWFPDDLLSIADALAQYENDERTRLYTSHANERSLAESRYQKAIAKLEHDASLHKLLSERSSPLDNPDIPESHPQQCLAWSKGRDYRDNYYREVALRRSRNARNITTRQAGLQVGVTEKTLRDMRDRLGIAVDPHYKIIEITKAEKVREQLDRFAPWAKDREYGRKIISSSGASINANYENLDEWVAQQLNAGNQILGRIQIAGLERLATPEEIQFKQESRLLKRQLKRHLKENHKAKEKRLAKEKARASKEAEERQRLLEFTENLVTEDTEQAIKKPKASPKRPRYKTMPDGFSPDYIEKQLALSQRDPVIVDAIRMGASISLLPPSTDPGNTESGEKGDHPLLDDPDPPPNIGIPPDN
jgi:hypothetical protein